MKHRLLTLIALVCIVVTNAKADYCYPAFDDCGVAEIDLSKIKTTGGVSYNASTKTLTANGKGTFYLEFDKLDMTYFSRFKLTQSGTDICHTATMTRSDGTTVVEWYSSKYDADLTPYSGEDIHEITRITWNVDGGAGETMTLSSFKFTSSVMVCYAAGETNLMTLDYGGSAGVPYKTVDGVSTYPIAYGRDNNTACGYADITDYDEVRVYEEYNQSLRLFLIPSKGLYNNYVQVYNTDGTYATWNADRKYISFSISAMKNIANWDGKVCLQAVISADGKEFSTPIRKIVVYKKPDDATAQYRIEGAGVITTDVQNALNDESATIIDATGITGRNVELTPANPNCIFKVDVREKLANSCNVMVGNTIDKLTIQDGKSFTAPADVNVNEVTYSRTVSGSSKYGTICFPCQLQSNDDIQYFELKSGDASSVIIKPVETVEAGTPVIFQKLNDATTITLTSSGKLSDVKDGSTTGTLTLKGTYNKMFITDTERLKKLFYISHDKVMNATVDLTIMPFRAYMESTTGSLGAKSYNILLEEDIATALNAVFNAEQSEVKVSTIYGANGCQQSELQKGINIVKFSDGTTKKFIIK